MKVKCFHCNVEMTALDDDQNRPELGTQFRSIGSMSSKVTNKMDGSVYSVVLCDACVGKGLSSGATRKENSWKKK
jgi:hypothetical protein